MKKQTTYTKKILITGAGGNIGKVLRGGLRKPEWLLRLCDIAPLGKAQENEELIQLDIGNLEKLEAAMQDIDCVVHLAGIAHESNWDRIFPANVVGAYHIFEAARKAKVPRVIFASSNHAVGFYRKEQLLDENVFPRPDSLYGVSKVFGEALGRLYADKHGISVACLRIGSFEEKPSEERHLRTWLSHRDLIQLVHQCIIAPHYHFMIIYGVSANKEKKWKDSASTAIGYHPVDNADHFSNTNLKKSTDLIEAQFHGGAFCSIEFDGNAEDIG